MIVKELRNYGWPISYEDTWPISSIKPKQMDSFSILPEYKIIPIHLYGNQWFYSESIKGTNINTWV